LREFNSKTGQYSDSLIDTKRFEYGERIGALRLIKGTPGHLEVEALGEHDDSHVLRREL
jgi:hypothetical protein